LFAPCLELVQRRGERRLPPACEKICTATLTAVAAAVATINDFCDRIAGTPVASLRCGRAMRYSQARALACE
jgi:hypothetical protein